MTLDWPRQIADGVLFDIELQPDQQDTAAVHLFKDSAQVAGDPMHRCN